jgi:hypothetical protein
VAPIPHSGKSFAAINAEIMAANRRIERTPIE